MHHSGRQCLEASTRPRCASWRPWRSSGVGRCRQIFPLETTRCAAEKDCHPLISHSLPLVSRPLLLLSLVGCVQCAVRSAQECYSCVRCLGCADKGGGGGGGDNLPTASSSPGRSTQLLGHVCRPQGHRLCFLLRASQPSLPALSPSFSPARACRIKRLLGESRRGGLGCGEVGQSVQREGGLGGLKLSKMPGQNADVSIAPQVSRSTAHHATHAVVSIAPMAESSFLSGPMAGLWRMWCRTPHAMLLRGEV
jgi:hypothetical protein